MPGRVLFTIGSRKKAAPYLEALAAAGVEAVCVTAEDGVARLNGYAGLVLGGGRDVDPALYGESPLDGTDEPDKARDAMESGLLEQALAADKPVFAICRGLQFVNVHLGGTLHQHIDGHSKVTHEVMLDPASLLARCAGETRYEVLSRHHQAVKGLAPGLRVTARAGDGTVEAVELDGPGFLLAVQWHPEDRAATSAPDRALFEAFAKSLV